MTGGLREPTEGIFSCPKELLGENPASGVSTTRCYRFSMEVPDEKGHPKGREKRGSVAFGVNESRLELSEELFICEG